MWRSGRPLIWLDVNDVSAGRFDIFSSRYVQSIKKRICVHSSSYRCLLLFLLFTGNSTCFYGDDPNKFSCPSLDTNDDLNEQGFSAGVELAAALFVATDDLERAGHQ